MQADYTLRVSIEVLDDMIEYIEPEANVLFWPNMDKAIIFSKYVKSKNDVLIKEIKIEYNLPLSCFELKIFCNEYHLNKSKLMYGQPKFVILHDGLVVNIDDNNIIYFIMENNRP